MEERVTGFDLRRVGATVRRHLGLLVVVGLGSAAVALGLSALQDPVYEAKADVLLLPRGSDAVFDSDDGPRLAQFATVETETEVLEGDPVQRLVRRELGYTRKISASRVGETEVMRVKAKSGDAIEAANIANAYARAYVKFRRDEVVNNLLEAAEELQVRIDGISEEIRDIEIEMAAAPPDTVSSLRPRYSALLSQQAVFRQKLDELRVDAALRSGGAQLVRAADRPDTPVAPQPVRNTLAGGVVGLLLAGGFAFLRDHLDDAIRTKDDLASAVASPVLAVVPTVAVWDLSKERADGRGLERGSAAAEAYRSLRTSLQLLGVSRPLRTIQVTSALPEEGKTSTLIELGRAFAEAGQRVVLVDCDLRKPRLQSLLETSGRAGLTGIFLGDVTAQQAVEPVPGMDGLYLLATGAIPANPAELVASSRMSEIVFELASSFDLVLLDSPPVLPVTDAIALSAWVDGVIMVVRSGSTGRREVRESVQRLEQVDAPVVGTVLNRVAERPGYGYPYDAQGPEPRVRVPLAPS